MSKNLQESQLNKTIGEQTGNAKAHLDSVEQLSNNITQFHGIFATNLENLVSEIKILGEYVRKNPHQIRKFMVDKMRPLQDELLNGEDYQKHENKLVQQNITQIKRQNKETADAIIKTFDKLKQMQCKVGKYL